MVISKDILGRKNELNMELLDEGILKLTIGKIKKVAKEHKIVRSVLLRGSLSIGVINKKFSDIDLTFIISENHTIHNIIKIKSEIKEFSNKKGVDISITFTDKKQLFEDSKRKIHFHGRKSAVYSKEIADSILIFGEDLREMFNKCEYYSILDIYRESCDLISHFHKDILTNSKKGINFSFILAKKCLNCKNLFPRDKKEIVRLFKEKIDLKKGNKLKNISELRAKIKLNSDDLEEIYSILVFCRNFIFNQINKNEYTNLIQIKSG